ncbi:MAG: 4-alpha-glucanotransferase [Meiothermus sp.]
MDIQRSFGILLHPTSFPGRWGIGTLGQEARRFVDWLASAGARWWQVLPLGPTGYGDSPYQSFSAFAGNPYLIDPDALIQRGWLEPEEPPAYPADKVDYGWLYLTRWDLLRRAYGGFVERGQPEDLEAFARYRQQEAAWLEDYALFMALKHSFGGLPWNQWTAPLRSREPAALEQARRDYADDLAFHAWTQWAFYQQWGALRDYAHAQGIRLIGDMPIFVAYDSSDVWAHPQYFYLDAEGLPTVVAGVPPDYFSETGQLWGNPLYRWEVMQAEGFAWWIHRIQKSLETCDLVRIDHFRGFEAYWEIPFGEPTAVKGQWVKAPGKELFQAVRAALGDAAIIAEDLGVITPEVEELRDSHGFPGMKILQFAFSDETNPFLPHHYPESGNVIVYTGTHDNDTTIGWYKTAPKEELEFMKEYLEEYGLKIEKPEDAPWVLAELGFRSNAKLVVLPLQDVLRLDTEARMNFPGTLGNNWSWRYGPDDLTPELARQLRALAEGSGRV